MTTHRQRLTFNPIIVKELRSRMRGWRAFGTLTLYLLLLAGFSYGVYRVTLSAGFFGSGMPLSPMIGQALFVAIANLSLFFVAFLTPALTASAISSEHEKLTLEMLQATPLNAHTILLGKLISAGGYIFLLLFAAIPIASLIFTFGGVAPGDMLRAALVILATGLTFGTIGLFFSAWRQRTIQAIALTYLTVLLFIGGSYVIFVFSGIMMQGLPPRYILILNPFSALGSILAASQYRAGPLGLLSILAGTEPFGNNSLNNQLYPLWYYSLLAYLSLSTFLYILATRFIKPIRRWRIRWQRLIIVGLTFTLYGVLAATLALSDYQTFRSWQPLNPIGPPPLGRPIPMGVAPDVFIKVEPERLPPVEELPDEREEPTNTETE